MSKNIKKPSTRFYPIKWKLSLSLIATGLSLVIIYVFIATRVFESDKLSYVFDAQGSRLDSLKREIDSRIMQSILSVRSLLATLDANGKMPAAASELFSEEKSLLAIEVWDRSSKKAILQFEKKPGSLANLVATTANQDVNVNLNEIKILKLTGTQFLLLFRAGKEETFLVRVILEGAEVLPLSESHEPLLLLQDGQIIFSSNIEEVDPDLISGLVQNFANENRDRTTIWTFNKQRFLLSFANLSLGKIKVMAFIPESEALGALRTLMYRSLVFLAFSGFGLVIISLLLARTLTANLRVLTESAAHVGQGHFDEVKEIATSDEMGVLSKAFVKMSVEIKRLLQETKEKTRMEAELKTAKLVQESLMPSVDKFSKNEVDIHGVVVTSTECGGDWWYYFIRGEDIYIAIADATGHGTPAALITAAARAVFSRMETETSSLSEMMKAWDFAVSSCSKKQVFMTGILLKVNSVTGACRCISAAHEPPFLFDRVESGFNFSLIELDAHLSLGDDLYKENLKEQSFEIAQGSALVLYTDGLFSVEVPGRRFSEKRLGKLMTEKMEKVQSAQNLTDLVMEQFNQYRGEALLPDDVTIVSVLRKGPHREAHLATIDGEDSGGLVYKTT